VRSSRNTGGLVCLKQGRLRRAGNQGQVARAIGESSRAALP
jgi:hypothetical protein